MKTISRTTSLGIMCGALLLPSIQAAPELLAPPYPGAVPDTADTNIYHATFLTRDPVEKVLAFYQPKVGTLHDAMDYSIEDNNGKWLMCPMNNTTICLGKILMKQGLVAGYLRDVTLAYDAGVKLMARRSAGEVARLEAAVASQQDTESARQIAELQAAQAKLLEEANELLRSIGEDPVKTQKIGRMSSLFEGLRQEVLTRRHSQDELLAVHDKYQHLDAAVFPHVREGQKLVSYDQWLLARKNETLRAQPMTDKDREQAAKKLEALYMAGKVEEAMKLSEELVAGTSTDYWNDWLDFLKDLDTHAYKTRIVIDVDPRSWGRKL